MFIVIQLLQVYLDESTCRPKSYITRNHSYIRVSGIQDGLYFKSTQLRFTLTSDRKHMLKISLQKLA